MGTAFFSGFRWMGCKANIHAIFRCNQIWWRGKFVGFWKGNLFRSNNKSVVAHRIHWHATVVRGTCYCFNTSPFVTSWEWIIEANCNMWHISMLSVELFRDMHIISRPLWLSSIQSHVLVCCHRILPSSDTQKCQSLFIVLFLIDRKVICSPLQNTLALGCVNWISDMVISKYIKHQNLHISFHWKGLCHNSLTAVSYYYNQNSLAK